MVAAFRWLDVLEKEFDKAFVDLDLMLNDMLIESENGDLVEETIVEFCDGARDKAKAMCSAWAQLVHKSQTIFQTNCKLEVPSIIVLFTIRLATINYYFNPLDIMASFALSV